MTDIKAQVTPDAPAWLDKARMGDGFYWCSMPHEPGPVIVEVRGKWAHQNQKSHGFCHLEPDCANYRWSYIHTPTPPAPLPKSRETTLTAKVQDVYAYIIVCEKIFASVRCPTATDAIKWVRDNYGIEPEVV